ncbi:MAG TPA: iron-containing alcohol dehydrogenase [Streptosporangiaceae bacterium]|nr:iron-containing alcohol dehydrogenase [Streptosporangiaceae bacterium]
MTAAAFEFATAGRIVFGAGRARELPEVLAGLGSRVLVCTGADPDRHAGLLGGLGLPAAVFPVAGEPTVDVARAATERAREHGADVVAAIGGGSVIDTGKAVAVLLGNGGDPLDYLEVVGAGRKITRPARPCVAVPTTAGTGAEVTANAVLAAPGRRLKASLRSPLMIPRVALVDPGLTVSCPRPVTAASGLDALTQCLEPLVSVKATPLTDGLAAEGLRRAAAGLRAAYADGGDLRARSDMAACSLLGGMALANAKLGAVHGLAGVIGGIADVPHGLACAALLVPVIEANVAALRAGPAAAPGQPVGQGQPGHPGHRALDRYARAAGLLTGRPDASVEDGITWIRETLARLEVPGLGAFGVRSDQADAIVAQAARSSSMQGNPVPLSTGALRAALLAAI